MNYQRVIPRDLFNEGNLLKCLGQLYLNLEVLKTERVEISYYGAGSTEGFDIQCTVDGDIYVDNISLHIRGVPYIIFRPLNSRRPYPVYTIKMDHSTLEVFNDDGTFHKEFLELLNDH